jgi:dienelactone hydrolase
VTTTRFDLQVLAALTLLAGGAAAQDLEAELGRDAGGQLDRAGPGDERLIAGVRGRVRGPDGAPFAGATVTVEVAEGDERSTTTDRKGRFALLDVPAGTRPIRVTAPGHLPSEGFVRAGASASTELEIELRSLEEGSPRFAEADPRATVHGWIERGNALLEQGRPGAARAEYEKALGILAGAERVPVLGAVARTYWLEGRRDDSVRAMEEALVADPSSGEARRLYETTLRELGREEHGERFLADLPRLAAAAAGARPSETPAAAPAVVQEPIEVAPPVAQRTGAATVHALERHPLANVEEMARRYGVTVAALRGEAPGALAHDLANESFDLFVPESYRPGDPWGVVVWVSPGERGGVRKEEVRALLAERRLLWVGANGAGNRRSRFDRAALALDALHLASGLYDVDPERVFVAGYSGGGRMASQLAFLFSDVFQGGVSWFGVDYYEPIAVPYRPGYHFPAGFPPPADRELERLRRHGRLALVTGERDFNRSETRKVFETLRADGFRGAEYFEIPGADHYHGLDAEWLGRALAHLEAR